MARRRRRRKKKGPRTFRDRTSLGVGLKIALGLIVAIVFLSVVQCTIKKPAAPSWTSQLNIPLIERRYDMAQLIAHIDEPSLTLDSAGNPFFSLQQDIDSLGISTSLTINSISQNIGQTLGLINITPQSIPPLTMAYSDLVPFPPGVVPPIPVDFVYDGPALSNYSSVTIGSGGIQAVLDNNMGLSFDTVIVDLIDLNTFQTLGSESIPGGMAAGTSVTVFLPLTGQTISNRFRIQVHAHTPGGVVLTTSDKSFTLTMGLTDPMSIQSGTAQIPEITNTFSRSAEINSPHLIQNATLQSGQLTLTLNNSTTLPVEITVVAPDLQSGAVPLRIIETLAANSTSLLSRNLAGYTFLPADQILPQQLDFNITIHSDSTAPGFATFNSSDSIAATLTLNNVAFSSVRGIFDTASTSFPPTVQALDIPNGFDSAQFTAATLTIEIDNGTELPGVLDLNIVSDNGATLNLTGAILPGSPAAPVTSAITANDLAGFLNPIPGSITVSGTVTMGDGVTSASITNSDFVRARVRIESPLEVFFDSTSVSLDIQSKSIDTADIRLITGHLISSQLNTTITSHLPLGVAVYLYLSSDSATLYSAPELTVGPIRLDGGAVDAFGIVTAATVSSSLISLDSADVQVLNTDTVYIGQIVTLHSSGGTPSRFMGADYLIIQASAVIEYKIGGGS